jgi:hypothetical protein
MCVPILRRADLSVVKLLTAVVTPEAERQLVRFGSKLPKKSLT